MKLYLTLEDEDGQKIERILQADKYFGDEMNNYVENMVQSLEDSKKPL